MPAQNFIAFKERLLENLSRSSETANKNLGESFRGGAFPSVNGVKVEDYTETSFAKKLVVEGKTYRKERKDGKPRREERRGKNWKTRELMSEDHDFFPCGERVEGNNTHGDIDKCPHCNNVLDRTTREQSRPHFTSPPFSRKPDLQSAKKELSESEGKLPQRNEYMDGKVSHHDYYSSIAKHAGIAFPMSHEVVKQAVESLKSGDTHLNKIPLKRWDNMGSIIPMGKAFKAHGDHDSMAGRVCVLKAAVRNSALQSMGHEVADEYRKRHTNDN